MKNLIEKIQNKQFNVGIIGLGYVGLPLSLRFADVGFPVTGFDIDQNKITSLEAGKSYIKQFPDQLITSAKTKSFTATSDFSKIKDMDAIIICVPTPLNRYREPDLSYVISTLEMLLPYTREGQTISLESTTYPGTTEEEFITRLEKQGYKIGENYFVLYSPEREDPGNKNFSTQTIPKVVGGHTEQCLKIGTALYAEIIDQVVPVTSTKVAEMTKLLENIHRAVNIGLVNEMKVVADKMGIDINEVISAAATKPFGFVPYRPGPGLGGHCIPIDPFYLTWKAREFGLHTRFIELAGEINSSMPQYVLNKLTEALNERSKSLKESKVLIIGMAYKKNIDDLRESPSLEMVEMLKEKGVFVDYHDPYAPTLPKLRKYDLNMSSVELSQENLKKYDAVMILTDHDDVNYEEVLEHAHLVIDTRGRYQQAHEKIIKA